jgi:poly(3-hydroxyalkanoate) synthetase
MIRHGCRICVRVSTNGTISPSICPAENRLATGKFVALGRRIDLSAVRHPIFLLGAAADEIVAPEQLFATANRVGTPRQHIEAATEPCGHLSLFLGAETMKRSWPRIARWLGEAP